MQYCMPNIWGGHVGDAPGIGHEFFLWLTGYNLANHYGLTFVHSPFVGDHTEPPENWNTVGRIDVPVKLWESFLNFGNGELIKNDLPENTTVIEIPRFNSCPPLDHREFIKVIDNYRELPNVLFLPPFNTFTPISWKTYYQDNLKKKYWARRQSNPILSHFSGQQISIAAHVRRCDVTPQQYPGRFQSNTYYNRIFEQILNIYPKAEIHVYSDAASMNELSQLDKWPNITFHIRSDIFTTLQALVSANILIMGISAFSVLAAYLSNGVKITRGWHPAWNKFSPKDYTIITTEPQGNFDINRFCKGMEGSNI